MAITFKERSCCASCACCSPRTLIYCWWAVNTVSPALQQWRFLFASVVYHSQLFIPLLCFAGLICLLCGLGHRELSAHLSHLRRLAANPEPGFVLLSMLTLTRHLHVTTQVYSVNQQDANLGKAGIIIACILGAVMVLAFSFISMLILLG